MMEHQARQEHRDDIADDAEHTCYESKIRARHASVLCAVGRVVRAPERVQGSAREQVSEQRADAVAAGEGKGRSKGP